MDRYDTFSIQLEGQGTYYGGQVLNGSVFVENDECISDIKTIKIKLSGFVNVYWVEKSGLRAALIDKNETFTNHEEYISKECILHQGLLSAGKHSFPFSFILPSSLPYSFEGKYGHIRYFVEAKLNRSGFFNTIETQRKSIMISDICDLNDIKEVGMPLSMSSGKTLGSLFMKSKPVSIALTIPRRGFITGEEIPITVEVKNLSNKQLSATKACIYQDVTFRATNGSRLGTKVVSTIIQEAQGGPIKAKSYKSWEGNPFSIPVIPTTGIGICKIITVNYRLEFIVSTSGIGSYLKVSLPIVVGNIPIRRNTGEKFPILPFISSSQVSYKLEDNKDSISSDNISMSTKPSTKNGYYDFKLPFSAQPIQVPVSSIAPDEYYDLSFPSYEDALTDY